MPPTPHNSTEPRTAHAPDNTTLLALLTPADVRDFFPAPLFDELRTLLPRFQLADPADLGPDGVARLLDTLRPDILLTGWRMVRLPAELPPELRYVCHVCGTVKGFLTRAHLEHGLLVSNWGRSISRTIAEAALFLTLASLRRAAEWSIAMHLESAWKKRDTRTDSLFARRVGIHGFGNIAREFLRLIAPFGCDVAICAPDVTPATEREWHIRRSPDLPTLFADNDVVVELAPLNAATAGCITEELLRRLDPGGLFVNVGRGLVVDEAALVRVAREGRVLFGLDVFAKEPLPPDHPLRGLRNVMLTPHLAGPTTDRRRDAGRHALDNLRAYLAGEKPASVVTPEAYDEAT